MMVNDHIHCCVKYRILYIYILLLNSLVHSKINLNACEIVVNDLLSYVIAVNGLQADTWYEI